jgi:S-(hydroxymethyl)glutathione dehydrogenase/alcohol dehydrogenase
MRASIVREAGSGFEVREVALDHPASYEVVVEVRASGLCHSDHLVACNDMPGFALPAVLGHEVAGVVAKVGPLVTDVAVGDHVVACMVQYCGKCAKCVVGKPAQCLNPAATLRPDGAPPRLLLGDLVLNQGFFLGGFAERVLVHENHLTKVPRDLPFAQAAIIGCGVVTGAGAVLNTAEVRQGETVVVMGAGGVGLNAVQGAVIAGASRIIVTDIDDSKLALARSLGATDIINSSKADPVETLKSILASGADHVFDFVGVRAVTAQGLDMVGMGGGLYLVGVQGDTAGIDISSPSLMFRHAKVQGVGMGSTVPRRDIPMFANLYLQGRYRLDELISKTIALGEIDQTYETMKGESMVRAVITSFD